MFKKLKKIFTKQKDESDIVSENIAHATEYVLEEYRNFIETQIRRQENIQNAADDLGINELLKTWEDFLKEQDRLEESNEIEE